MNAEPDRFDAQRAAEQILERDRDLVAEQPVLPAQQLEGRYPAPDERVLPGALTDRGNAKLFARLYADKFRYDPPLHEPGLRRPHPPGARSGLTGGHDQEQRDQALPRPRPPHGERRRGRNTAMTTTGTPRLREEQPYDGWDRHQRSRALHRRCGGMNATPGGGQPAVDNQEAT